jgi:hypothetical protein
MVQYRELPVYQEACDLLFVIFQFTKDLGKEYKYSVVKAARKRQSTIWRSSVAPKAGPTKRERFRLRGSISRRYGCLCASWKICAR